MAAIPFTIRQLEYFDAVASEGSLAAAALRCHVSASALALALDELEHHLGVQLFVRRKGKGVILTNAGSRLLSHARRVLSGADGLATDAGQTAKSLSGRFAIGCFSSLAPFFLPGIMEDFQGTHPALDIEIEEADAPWLDEMLLQGRIDVALLYSVDVSPQLAFDPLHELLPYVLVGKSHPLADRVSVKLEELADEPLILFDRNPTRRNTENIFAKIGLKPKVGHTTTNFELTRCLVGRGLGYGLLFQRPAATTTYDGHEIVMLEIEDDVPGTVVGLARPAGAPRTARYTALLDHLLALTAKRRRIRA